jgi:hypothetical protein
VVRKLSNSISSIRSVLEQWNLWSHY